MEKKIIDRLVKEYGSPLYVFQKERLVSDYNRLVDAFRSHYPKYRVAYSYKTNYAPRVCQIMKGLGALAEVVSDMEMNIAQRVGYRNEEIIYNGPMKGPQMEEFLLNGGVVNIDNAAEAERIIALAEANPDKKLTVGIRVNMNVGQNFVSRFGMEAYTEEFDMVFNKLEATKNIEIIGMHCHIGHSRHIEAWKIRSEYMLGVVDHYFDRPLKFIDLGSGMFGNCAESFGKQFGDYIPTFEDYAEVVAGAFAEHYKKTPDEEKPWLLTEPGTTIISANMDVITTVTGMKTVRGKHFANTDSSIHIVGELCRIKDLPIEVVNANPDSQYFDDITLSGYTCLEYDVILKSFKGKVGVGDYLIVGNCGGYTNVSKPPFIGPQCAMIELDENNNTFLFKRSETVDDILSTYIF